MKYLVLDERFNFKEHFIMLVPRVEGVAIKLGRILPNVEGYAQIRGRICAKLLRRIQRQMTLRIAQAYWKQY